MISGMSRPSSSRLAELCTPSTRVLINFHSGLWQLPLAIAQWLSLASPMLPQNWLTPDDARGMLRLAGFETIRVWHEVLWPFGFGGLFNKILVRFWPFHQFALANFMTARLQPQPIAEQPSVSVIIPARNEAGNVRAIFERMPMMGADDRTDLRRGPLSRRHGRRDRARDCSSSQGHRRPSSTRAV